MTAADLCRWQREMSFTGPSAADALGMSLSGYQKLRLGKHPIDRRMALACAALAAGLEPWQKIVA